MISVNFLRPCYWKLGEKSLKTVNDFLNKGSLSGVGEFPVNWRNYIYGL